MKWWPIFGLTKKLTERKQYSTDLRIEPYGKIFGKSLHIYPIDVGNSNDLNFDIRALQAPQYNIHRLGIYFADSPRHADLLIVLGNPTAQMIEPLINTVEQMPKPFGILLVGQDLENNVKLPNVVGRLRNSEPAEILGALLKIMERD